MTGVIMLMRHERQTWRIQAQYKCPYIYIYINIIIIIIIIIKYYFTEFYNRATFFSREHSIRATPLY